MNYLDMERTYKVFEEMIGSQTYVDKSLLIEKISEWIRREGKYICITRPRRFGKTINANMLAAYYTKGFDSHPLFDHLNIAKTEYYEKHLNNHHVIYIDLSRMPFQCKSYDQYITSIYNKLCEDILSVYQVEGDFSSPEDLLKATQDSFIFVLDEWDAILYKDFMSDNDKKEYLEFLQGLLKDQIYVELAYMTGILPIAKCDRRSELNMFEEYDYMNDDLFAEYFEIYEDIDHSVRI